MSGGYIFFAGPVFEIRFLVFSDRLAFSHLASDQGVVVDIILLRSMRNEMDHTIPPQRTLTLRMDLWYGPTVWTIPRLPAFWEFV